jgi:hypothetical protein
VGALDGIMGMAMPLTEFVVGQVKLQVETSWHASVLK